MIEQKREYYRVEYPINDRPVLLSRDKKFEVIDISEGGVKFRVDNNGCFLVGDVLGVSIRFSDNYIFNCMGKIVRVDNENVAVNNIHHIPLERIRSEHLQLIQKYHVKH